MHPPSTPTGTTKGTTTVPSATAPAHWTAHCDGSASPNPGPIGIGVVLLAPDGTRHPLSRTTHAYGCNNEAELLAVTDALHALQAHGVRSCTVYCDSSVVVEQLCAPRAQPIAGLAPAFEAARALLASFDGARLQWIPRHRNHEADALARAALGKPQKPPAGAGRKRRR